MNKDKYKWNRSAGVLMHMTSLYGPFGIGVMGKEAREFVDFLCNCGFFAWQVLPMEHTWGWGSHSPYKCVSAFAGNPVLIDPRPLFDVGLITPGELKERLGGMETHTIKYNLVYGKQMTLLRSAYRRISEEMRDQCRGFDPFWFSDYALYMTLSELHGTGEWIHWSDEGLGRHDEKAVREALVQHEEEIEFYRFIQWLFHQQWQELKEYAAERGISMIGDMPIYVSQDSADFWAQRALFDVDENLAMRTSSGVPPDYFAKDGQHWGNPLYNWQAMKEDGYQWWIRRMKTALERYDVVRIDHFRAFDSYWMIPAQAKSAANGWWVKGPGAAPFQAMEQALGRLPIFAEDLGDVGKEAQLLRRELGMSGTRVLQFGFVGDGMHLPHQYGEDTFAYTGTHDNTTLLAWMFEMTSRQRRRALTYCGYEGDWSLGGPGCGICLAWIRLLLLSRAAMVVIPIQDLLGYGADTRMNVPGVPDGNWRVRITKSALDEINTERLRELVCLYDRYRPARFTHDE